MTEVNLNDKGIGNESTTSERMNESVACFHTQYPHLIPAGERICDKDRISQRSGGFVEKNELGRERQREIGGSNPSWLLRLLVAGKSTPGPGSGVHRLWSDCKKTLCRAKTRAKPRDCCSR